MLTKSSAWSKEGLTIRSILGIIFAGLVFQPAAIFIYLYTGTVAGFAAQFATVFLFTELARLSGRPLSRREALTIYYGSLGAATEFTFVTLLERLWIRRCPTSQFFGLTQIIPDWWAPPPDAKAVLNRTLIDPIWILPISLLVITGLLMRLCGLSLGFLCDRLYVEEEKLPFPMAHVDYEFCNVLTVKERTPTSRQKTFLLCAIIGLIYSFFLYTIPLVTEQIRGVRTVIIPLPWIDLTPYIDTILPGASFGVSTDLMIIGMGLFLPPVVSCSWIAGSLAIYFIANHLLVKYGISMFAKEWFPGMSLSTIWQRSILHFWASPIIGVLTATAIIPLLRRPRSLIGAIRALAKPTMRESWSLSLKTILIIFLGTTLSSAFIAHIFVPDFPLWIFILFTVGWNFVATLIAGKVLGESGTLVTVPFVKEWIFSASGYSGTSVWFAPLIAYSGTIGMWAVENNPTGAIWAQWFKVARLTKMNPWTLIKMYFLIVYPLSWILGFIYISAFWTLAPMPSSFFPMPLISVAAVYTGLFVTRSVEITRPVLLLGSLVSAGAISILFDLLHIPFSLAGLGLGFALPLPNAMGVLVGLLAGLALRRMFGDEWYHKHRFIAAAGLFAGEAIMVAFSASVAMILRALWAIPY